MRLVRTYHAHTSSYSFSKGILTFSVSSSSTTAALPRLTRLATGLFFAALPASIAVALRLGLPRNRRFGSSSLSSAKGRGGIRARLGLVMGTLVAVSEYSTSASLSTEGLSLGGLDNNEDERDRARDGVAKASPLENDASGDSFEALLAAAARTSLGLTCFLRARIFFCAEKNPKGSEEDVSSASSLPSSCGGPRSPRSDSLKGDKGSGGDDGGRDDERLECLGLGGLAD